MILSTVDDRIRIGELYLVDFMNGGVGRRREEGREGRRENRLMKGRMWGVVWYGAMF